MSCLLWYFFFFLIIVLGPHFLGSAALFFSACFCSPTTRSPQPPQSTQQPQWMQQQEQSLPEGWSTNLMKNFHPLHHYLGILEVLPTNLKQKLLAQRELVFFWLFFVFLFLFFMFLHLFFPFLFLGYLGQRKRCCWRLANRNTVCTPSLQKKERIWDSLTQSTILVLL